MVFIKIPKFDRIIGKLPTRFNVAIMMFISCFVSYMMRVNLSINIIAMVEPKLTENATAPPDYGPRYNWSSYEQSVLLGSFFWGYLFTSLPGGMLAEWIGGRDVIGYTLCLSTIFTALTPIAAQLHFWVVFAIRFLIGFLGGVLYPAEHNLISKWAPPNEKGKFVSALMGGTFGTLVTWPLSGLIVETLGWEWAFYIAAIICGIVCAVWFIIVADDPSVHRSISKEEREHIEKSLGDSVSKSKGWPPFISLITSLPFWALLILHYGNMWGLFFLITAAPKFMSEVLGFKMAKAGLLSSLPYLARLFMAFGFGAIGDYLRRCNCMSVTMTRKTFCIFSHVIPGVLLICLAYFGRDPYVCVAIMTLSLGFNGAATITNLQNSQDLAPNYAGTLYGAINFIGTTSGFFTPLIVTHFTSERNTIEEWQCIFLIGGAVYIISAIIFGIFGSGNVQKWNEVKKSDDINQETGNIETNTKF